jgi:hypothetical protein
MTISFASSTGNTAFLPAIAVGRRLFDLQGRLGVFVRRARAALTDAGWSFL